MELYTLLRAFADSWFLLAMTLFYLGVIAWAFRPGSRATHDEISQIPLRDDDFDPRAMRKEAE
ncbi:MAG: cbb3-type cytochrome c oxidase subunit 3 [Pseudomonadota bacterium]